MSYLLALWWLQHYSVIGIFQLHYLSIYLFGGTGDWTQRLRLARERLYHQFHYNLMEPLSYMWSVTCGKVVTWHDCIWKWCWTLPNYFNELTHIIACQLPFLLLSASESHTFLYCCLPSGTLAVNKNTFMKIRLKHQNELAGDRIRKSKKATQDDMQFGWCLGNTLRSPRERGGKRKPRPAEGRVHGIHHFSEW
jgi:hypothetical protein